MTRSTWLLPLAFLASGCGQTHPGVEVIGGYPADMPTAMLTTRDAWEPLCEWARSLREGQLERYWCGADLVPVAEEPAEFPRTVQSWLRRSRELTQGCSPESVHRAGRGGPERARRRVSFSAMPAE